MNPLESIYKLFGKQTQVQASETVYSQATYYPYFVRLFIPRQPINKLLPGFESTKKIVRSRKNKPSDEDVKRSVRRTKRNIFDICATNEFEIFVTHTFDSDRHNDQIVIKRMMNWFKNEKKRRGKFEHITVPERHKSGAIHFHSLFKGYKGELLPAISPHTGKLIYQKSRQVFNLKSYKSGFTTAVKIDDGIAGQTAVSNYLVKYITKDMPRLSNNHRYWVSRGIKRPKQVNNSRIDIAKIKPVWKSSNEYGDTYIFSLKDVEGVDDE